MSRLIKSSSVSGLAAVRTLSHALAVREAPSKQDEENERLRRRVAALEAEQRRSDASIASLRVEAEAAFEQGKSEGRQLGLAEAATREEDRLDLLAEALGSAHAEFAKSLASLERLAPVLARDALDMMLGNPDYRSELMEGAIAAELAKIEKAMVVAIIVSGADFPDAHSVSTAAKHLGVQPSLFAATAEIPSGHCTMKLRLGAQEIGISQQWGILRERLAELSLAGEEA